MAQNLESHLTAQTDRSRRLFWHRLRWEAVRAHLPESPFRLVDVGAGAGHLGDYLAEERPQAKYAFVEPIAALREKLRTRWGDDADLGAAKSFEGAAAVALLDVLEHQEDDVAFLRDLAQKMDRGAQLLITVPALNLLWSDWDEGLGHHRRYTRGMLRKVIAAAGLQAEEVSYLFPEMLPMALFRRFASGKKKSGDAELELPDLPAPINGTLYAVGWVTQRLRRFHPVGTSLIAVARKP